jgi:hypothetical protein
MCIEVPCVDARTRDRRGVGLGLVGPDCAHALSWSQIAHDARPACLRLSVSPGAPFNHLPTHTSTRRSLLTTADPAPGFGRSARHAQRRDGELSASAAAPPPDARREVRGRRRDRVGGGDAADKRRPLRARTGPRTDRGGPGAVESSRAAPGRAQPRRRRVRGGGPASARAADARGLARLARGGLARRRRSRPRGPRPVRHGLRDRNQDAALHTRPSCTYGRRRGPARPQAPAIPLRGDSGALRNTRPLGRANRGRRARRVARRLDTGVAPGRAHGPDRRRSRGARWTTGR